MKRFVRLIAKKTIVTYVFPQRGAVNKVGMENKPMAFGLVELAIAVYAGDLSRCHKNQCAFLVVIRSSAIGHIPAFYIFQKNGIKSKIHTAALPRGGL